MFPIRSCAADAGGDRTSCRRRLDRAARAGVAVRPDEAAERASRRAHRSGHPSRSAPVAPAPLARAVGATRRSVPGPVAATRRHRHRGASPVAGLARPRRAGVPVDAEHRHAHRPAPPPGGRCPTTLLGRCSTTSATITIPARITTAESDRSVQVHACHGPARQVEVLREVLVGLLADDPTLEPRDVLVMCPDIEVYAPLIAGGVRSGRCGPRDERPSRASSSGAAGGPCADPDQSVVGHGRPGCWNWPDGRVSASDVLDLASWPPVRRRFGFDDDDLDRLAQWVAQSGVRWGIDAQHREQYGLQRFSQNTWRTGLDRILLGVAMADEDGNRLGLALPLDDVGSGDVELAGRLAELLDRLQSALDQLTGDRSAAGLAGRVERIGGALTDVSTSDGWQQAELRRELAASRRRPDNGSRRFGWPCRMSGR